MNVRFIGLRPRLYSFGYERKAHFDIGKNGVEEEVKKPTATSVTRNILDNKNTPKGVKVNVAKTLSFDKYECCLRSLLTKRVDIKRIGSNLGYP